MAKEQRSYIFTRVAVIMTALVLGFGGGRLIKANTLTASASDMTHAEPVAYTQAESDVIEMDYAQPIQLAVADDL